MGQSKDYKYCTTRIYQPPSSNSFPEYTSTSFDEGEEEYRGTKFV